MTVENYEKGQLARISNWIQLLGSKLWIHCLSTSKWTLKRSKEREMESKTIVNKNKISHCKLKLLISWIQFFEQNWLFILEIRYGCIKESLIKIILFIWFTLFFLKGKEDNFYEFQIHKYYFIMEIGDSFYG